MGLEADGDSINSNNLGLHARNRGAGYVDLDLRPAKKRWSLSVGAREEIFSGGAQAVFSPELAGSLRVANSLKLRASGGYGFRIPTYTDLYYSDPSTLGNPKSETGVGVVGRWRRGLDAVGEAHAFGDRILFAAARHDRLRESDDVAESLPAAVVHGCKHLVRGQPEWTALCGRRIDDSRGFPEKSQTVRIEWTALHGAQTRAAWAGVGVRVQLSGREHSCFVDLDDGTRFRADECSATCAALPADGVPGVECDADARRVEGAAVSAADECEQHRLPGDRRA